MNIRELPSNQANSADSVAVQEALMEGGAQSQKSHINLVVLGQQGCGKSTITGHLLWKVGAVDGRVLDRCEKEAAEKNKKNCKYAWVSDKTTVERERGHSTEISTWSFETNNHACTLIDAPGSQSCMRSLIAGAAQADAVILVLDATPGSFEAGVAKDGQAREHAMIAHTLGLKQVIVVVNKLDLVEEVAQQQRFNDIQTEAVKVLKRQHPGIAKAQFIPLSGWTGDNIEEGSPPFSWHSGPPLLQAIDGLEPVPRARDKPLRLPVQDVFKIGGIGTVPTGRVEAGALRTGMKVRFSPGGIEAEVASVELHHEVVDEALPGDNVGFHVKGVPVRQLRRGYVVSDAAVHPARECMSFTAELGVINHPGVIKEGYCPIVDVHTAHVPCRFDKLEATVDKRSKAVLQERPEGLKAGDQAVVVLRPTRPLVVESFSEFPSLGRFAVRDMNVVVAVGVIKAVEYAPQ